MQRGLMAVRRGWSHRKQSRERDLPFCLILPGGLPGPAHAAGAGVAASVRELAAKAGGFPRRQGGAAIHSMGGTTGMLVPEQREKEIGQD